MRSVMEIINDAFAMHRNGEAEKAVQVYDRMLGLLDEPDPNLLIGYAFALAESGYPGLGKHLLLQATSVIADIPESAGAWANLGYCFKQVDREESARACYEKALSLQPNHHVTASNMAALYINVDEAKTAEMWARRALESNPDYPDAHQHLAQALLEQERYDEAWEHYEYRWKLTKNLKNVRNYGCPRWDGKPVDTLVIHGEQGLGDEILYCSVIDRVRPLAKRIIIECAPRLMKLFEDSFGLEVHPNEAELKKYHHKIDASIPMGSLWSVVGLPDGKPFLKAHPKIETTRPLIGLSWKGGVPRTYKKYRGTKLKQWKPILETPGVDFISVQYGGAEVEAEAQEMGLKTPENTNLDTLVGWIASCDLVITVCQTNVHIAGGLGKPCWVLTPRARAWRYAGNSPRMRFYDSVRLFRQHEFGEWQPVIGAIVHDLRVRYN